MPHLKALGLILLGALALCATASPAAAKPFEFHFEKEPTQLTASIDVGEDVFGFDAGLLECTEVSYGGAVFGTVSSEVIPLTPTYEACTAFGFKATVDMNGCFYVFKAEEAEANYEGSFAIACPTNQIEVTMAGCTVTIGAQEKLKKVTYTNVGMGANRSVTISLNLTGIAYEEHKKGPIPTCTHPDQATKNGTLSGTLLVKGEPVGEKGAQGLWVE